MPNTKHKANSPTVIEIHEEWAIKNGYAQARKRKGEDIGNKTSKLLQEAKSTSSQACKRTRPQADEGASRQARKRSSV